MAFYFNFIVLWTEKSLVSPNDVPVTLCKWKLESRVVDRRPEGRRYTFLLFQIICINTLVNFICHTEVRFTRIPKWHVKCASTINAECWTWTTSEDIPSLPECHQYSTFRVRMTPILGSFDYRQDWSLRQSTKSIILITCRLTTPAQDSGQYCTIEYAIWGRGT